MLIYIDRLNSNSPNELFTETNIASNNNPGMLCTQGTG